MSEEIRELMSSIFMVDINRINESSNPRTIANWDSMRHMKLVVELEKKFGVEFDEDEIPEMTSPGIIERIIKAKKHG